MTTEMEQHLSDAQVVRAVDDELALDERAQLHAHLAACATCAERMERFRMRERALSALLLDTDFDVPAAAVPQPRIIDLAAARERREQRRRPLAQRPWLRVAAGIVLLLGVALTMTPLQAMVADWLRAQWSRIAGDTPSEQPATTPQTTPPRGARVEFAPQAATFRIEIAAAQSSGSLAVRRVPGSLAVADASRTGIEFLVLPDGVRIINTSGADADYEIRVPATVASVVIVIDGRRSVELSPTQLDAGHSRPVR